MSGRLDLPHIPQGDRGMLSDERSMGMGAAMSHQLSAFNEQQRQQELEYRLLQERAGMLDRRALHLQGMSQPPSQQYHTPYAHPMRPGPMSTASLYGGMSGAGGMSDMGGMSHAPMGGLPSARSLQGIPGYPGTNGSTPGMGAGSHPFSGMGAQQLRGSPWGAMPGGMPPHYGGSDEMGGAGGPRHHLPPHQNQSYMMYGAEQQDE